METLYLNDRGVSIVSLFYSNFDLYNVLYECGIYFSLKAVTLVTLYRLAVLFSVNAGESIIF